MKVGGGGGQLVEGVHLEMVSTKLGKVAHQKKSSLGRTPQGRCPLMGR